MNIYKYLSFREVEVASNGQTRYSYSARRRLINRLRNNVVLCLGLSLPRELVVIFDGSWPGRLVREISRTLHRRKEKPIPAVDYAPNRGSAKRKKSIFVSLNADCVTDFTRGHYFLDLQ